MGAQLYGRRLYEDMLPWQQAEQRTGASQFELEFARIWRATPKLVFSRTLAAVADGFTLSAGDAVEQVTRMKREPGGVLAVGGAGLAASLIQAGLVDEYRPLVFPVLLGGGTPYLPALVRRIELELLETRRFASGVAYARYGRPD